MTIMENQWYNDVNAISTSIKPTPTATNIQSQTQHQPSDHHIQIMDWIQTLPYQFDNVSSPGKGPGPK